MSDVVTSAANPVVKRMNMLANRKFRQREGVSVVEGIQPVWQAVEAGLSIEVIVYAPTLLRYEPAVKMVLDQERSGVRVVRLSGELFERLSNRDGPSGLAAIIRQRLSALDGLIVTARSTFVALHQVANPGNLGTIIRTADATGTAGIVLVGATADPYDPDAIKASMGAIFNMPVARAEDSDEFFDWAQRHDVTVATTAARAKDSLWEAEYPSPLAVFMGSEGSGLHDADLERGSLQIRIPMVGTPESLNLAVATSVILYEVRRRRASPRS